ncbi:MAG: LysE family translocator [Actinomycetes bacterium]
MPAMIPETPKRVVLLRTVGDVVTTRSLLLFVAASLPLIVFPGPSVAFILGTTLHGGRRSGLAATAGVELGYLVHVLGAVIGVSAVIATTAAAFTAVKVAGACWLLWLAWQAWRSTGDARLGDLGRSTPATGRTRSAFRRGLLVGALNPKTAVFYLAFLPQFVTADGGPVWAQLLVFGLLFIALATVVDAQWAILGDGLRRLVPRLRMRVVDRVSGVVYAMLAVVTLGARRLGSA